MLIVVSGLPGAGKSVLADALGPRLGAAVLSVDPIEAAIWRWGISPSFDGDVHRQRLESWDRQIDGFPEPSWEDVDDNLAEAEAYVRRPEGLKSRSDRRRGSLRA